MTIALQRKLQKYRDRLLSYSFLLMDLDTVMSDMVRAMRCLMPSSKKSWAKLLLLQETSTDIRTCRGTFNCELVTFMQS